jgi:hypothetical protein
MGTKTIAAALAGLGTVIELACAAGTPPAAEIPASADADADDGREPTTTSSERSFEIAPGQFAEANFRMAKGSTVTVTFGEGGSEIAWDVHSHDHEGGTQIHDQGRGGEGAIEFVAPSEGVFSVLWKNTGSSATPLRARVDLGAGASIHSWMPAE